MRAKTRPISILNGSSKRLRAMIASGSLGVTAAIAAPALAQDTGTFSLPSPTPTPTPAPQGPVDIRDGVVIGPRTIPAERPPATESSASVPAPTPTPTPTPVAPPSPTATGADRPTATTPRTTSEAPAPVRETPRETAPSATLASDPPTLPATTSVPEDLPTTTNSGSLEGGTEASAGSDFTSPEPVNPAAISTQTSGLTLWPWLAGLLVLLSGTGWWFWRRRSALPAGARVSAPDLAAGVRRTMPPNVGTPAPDVGHGDGQSPGSPSPVPAPAAVPRTEPSPTVGSLDEGPRPANIALQLDVASASRSLMAFTVEYRLNIANRSDGALRDLGISAQLVCARSGAVGGAAETGRPIQLIERIGPHQSRSVVGEVQLALSSVSPLRQGATPLLIPLLQVTLHAAGIPTKTHNFVIGAPSATSATRLHPIPLDTPPGGVPGLRAREIKDAPQPQTA